MLLDCVACVFKFCVSRMCIKLLQRMVIFGEDIDDEMEYEVSLYKTSKHF